MSKDNKLNWLSVVVLIVLMGCMAWLVVVNQAEGAENGLECLYNCGDYQLMLETL